MSTSTLYRHLDPDKTLATIQRLHNRIEERFPHSSLSKVCAELHELGVEANHKADDIARPRKWMRIAIAALFLVAAAIVGTTVWSLDVSWKHFFFDEFVQTADAALNSIVVLGAAIVFLMTLESRWKRKRALDGVREIRAIAHVIDMHQLTKDPSGVFTKWVLTPSSPKRTLTAFELTRYLDYCSEMLSLAGKVAAFYAEKLKDDVVLRAVNDVESMATGLSRKVWQKIMILQEYEEDSGKAGDKAREIVAG